MNVCDQPSSRLYPRGSGLKKAGSRHISWTHHGSVLYPCNLIFMDVQIKAKPAAGSTAKFSSPLAITNIVNQGLKNNQESDTVVDSFE
jgi:hypothetical protein